MLASCMSNDRGNNVFAGVQSEARLARSADQSVPIIQVLKAKLTKDEFLRKRRRN